MGTTDEDTTGPDAGELAEGFAAALADARFPATRDDLVEAARAAGAPDEVLGLLAALDDQAPFTTIDQAWDEATGPDAS
jgi:hypothetical protein